MFIPSIDAMWCECLTFFYKIGFSSLLLFLFLSNFNQRTMLLVEKLEKPIL